MFQWNSREIWLYLGAVVLAIFLVFAEVAAEEKKVKTEDIKNNTNKVSSDQETIRNLATYIEFERAISKSTLDLKDKVGDLVDPGKYQEQIKDIRVRLDKVEWQLQMAQTELNLAHAQLSAFDVTLHSVELALTKIGTPMVKSIQLLSDWEVEWSKRMEELDEWKVAATKGSSLSFVIKNIEDLSTITANALQGIHRRLRPAIETGQRISKLQVRTYALIINVGNLIDETKKRGFDQTTPQIFSKNFFGLLNYRLLKTTAERIDNSFQKLRTAVEHHLSFFLLNFVAIALLAAVIKFSHRHLSSKMKWYYFSKRPVSVSLFMFFLFYHTFNFTLVTVPVDIETVYQVFLVLSVIMLTGVIVKYTPKELQLLRTISAILITVWLCRVVSVPEVFMQLFVTIISFCMICYCLWQSWNQQKKKGHRIIIIVSRLIIVPLAVVFLAMAGGYGAFALYVFVSLLVSIVAAKVVVLTGLLELIIVKFPIKLVQENMSAIVERLAPVIALFTGIVYLIIILKEWEVYPTRQIAGKKLLAFDFSLGGMNISPGVILITIGTVYAVFMISKTIQRVLLDEVLPRYRVEHGVQLSMVRLMHYFILVIGFIVLLNILGFELTKLTILGGALGVGIGFGLQEIVNNFVSGLILLFERPIKIGDTVQVGNDLGVVKKLGLRATVVSTVDDAEIVIPNSDLITVPVTNWTLSGRQARVKVPVGVAYGSDIHKVLEVLMTCANDHPLVMTQPIPKALFLSFGASSLDFELRVWIPDFSERRQVLSELNQEIESEFSLAGIEIPFPQTDLHLRSVDAAVSLKGSVV